MPGKTVFCTNKAWTQPRPTGKAMFQMLGVLCRVRALNHSGTGARWPSAGQERGKNTREAEVATKVETAILKDAGKRAPA